MEELVNPGSPSSISWPCHSHCVSHVPTNYVTASTPTPIHHIKMSTRTLTRRYSVVAKMVRLYNSDDPNRRSLDPNQMSEKSPSYNYDYQLPFFNKNTNNNTHHHNIFSPTPTASHYNTPTSSSSSHRSTASKAGHGSSSGAGAGTAGNRRLQGHLYTFLGMTYRYRWRILLFVFPLFIFFFFWELHVEMSLYSRHWIESEIKSLSSLHGCFDKARIANSAYNVTLAMGPKHTEIQAGMPMQLGLDCYDFAGTIQPNPSAHPPQYHHTQLYHTYWRVDLAPLGTRQEWMLKSFFATQNPQNSKLILWSNGDLSRNPVLRPWLARYPDRFELRTASIRDLAQGTALQDSSLLNTHDQRAWVDGDLLRLLLLWNFGGAWVDMDTLLTRDFSPLLEHEFVTQWDCHDKKYTPFNGALMNFFKHSPYLCEFFHIMASSPPPRKGSTDWGSTLYLKLWRRLIANGIPPFKILPFCFSEGRSCRLDNRLPDPFAPDKKTWANGLSLQEEDSPLNRTLQKIFAIHLHNQWEKTFPENGWVDRYLLRKFNMALSPSLQN